MPSSTGRIPSMVDCKDLDGLRGIASVWIMMFHVILFADTGKLLDLQGSTLMPLFFLLSGFSLAIGYAGKFTSESSFTMVSNQSDHGSGNVESASDSNDQFVVSSSTSMMRKYFYNRFIRIFPVYYICMCVSIPLSYYGYGSFDANPVNITTIAAYIQNFIPTTTWTAFLFSLPFNGPQWTISTLLAFWICFPHPLVWCERKTDSELLTIILHSFWWNLALGIGLFLYVAIKTENGGLAFVVATFWPVSRFPIFVMGVAAGVLCHRSAKSETMLWFDSGANFFPLEFFYCHPAASFLYNDRSTAITRGVQKTSFGEIVRYQSIALLFLTLLWFIIIAAIQIQIVSNFWFQLLNPFAQLSVIVGLTRVSGKSMASTVLRHPYCLWLGEISMSLYMIHWPCLYYLVWILYGSNPWPKTFNCLETYPDDEKKRILCQQQIDAFTHHRMIPSWGIVVVPLISILTAASLYYFVEEPIRKYWK